jgi:hypothetical protein
MIANLLLASLMVMICVTVHFVGLVLLMRILRLGGAHLPRRGGLFGHGLLILLVVHGLVLAHTIEVWAFALAYVLIGAIPHFDAALYFSTTTFTTIGYGDVVLPVEWRLFGAIEGAVGLILFGWSTAFLISIVTHMRTFEHDWLEQR